MAVIDFIPPLYWRPADFVADLRSRLGGIPQSRLAERAGIEPTNLTKYLNGRKSPSLETMLTLDKALEQLLKKAA